MCQDYQWARKYPSRIQAVTLDDLNRVARTYLKQFLEKDKWYLAVSCHASKVRNTTLNRAHKI